MSPRSIVPVLCTVAVVLLSAPAGAESHRGDLGAGGVRATGGLYGAALTANWTLTELPEPGAAAPGGEAVSVAAWEVSAVADVAYVSGTRDGGDYSRTSFLAGPRFTLARVESFRRLMPFGEVLVGSVRQSGSASDTHLGGAFGVGLDVPLGSLAPAARPPAIALRARYAKHWINEDTTAWYDEVVVALVWRFTRK